MNLMQISDFNKVSKYVIRLRKSVIRNDINKIGEYYDHLKYHIQLGGEPKQIEELQSKFDSIDQIIKNLKADSGSKYKYSGITVDDLETCTKQKEELETTLAKATDEVEKLKTELEAKTSESEEIKKLSDTKTEEEKEINKTVDNLKELNQKLILQIDGLRSESKTSKQQVEDIEKKLQEVFELYGIVEDSVEKRLSVLKDKADNYKQMIKKINDEATGMDLTGANELEKFESAIKAIKAKSDNVKNTETELSELKESLSDSKKEKEELAEKLKELEAKISTLDDLKTQLNNKDKQIAELEEKNKSLENANKEMVDEKEQVNKELTSIASTFDSKLKLLLETIYGKEQIVEDLMNGVKIGDRTA